MPREGNEAEIDRPEDETDGIIAQDFGTEKSPLEDRPDMPSRQ